MQRGVLLRDVSDVLTEGARTSLLIFMVLKYVLTEVVCMCSMF